jgi:hypothetical protein
MTKSLALSLFLLAGGLPLAANPAGKSEPQTAPKAGAVQSIPSRSHSFYSIYNTSVCRVCNWTFYKFDAVCGQLRPEKEPAFIPMMKESRVHSPDLIALNHRLPLGEVGLSLMTTGLWDGQETYLDNRMESHGLAAR